MEHALHFRDVPFDETFRLPSHSAVIRVPWKDGVMETRNEIAIIKFPNARSVALLSLEKHPYVYETIVGANPAQIQESQEVYGNEIAGSAFTMWLTILRASPDQLHWRMGPSALVGLTLLLTHKTIFLSDRGNTGIFVLKTDSLEGFQVGEAQSDAVTRLNLFQRGTEGPEYVLLIQGTQDEIDYIVAHLRIGL